jgi:hypothetical protein
MIRYSKETPRLTVKFYDGDTEEKLFEINNRTWMDVGELFSDHQVSALISQSFDDPPENVIVIVSGEYSLQ